MMATGQGQCRSSSASEVRLSVRALRAMANRMHADDAIHVRRVCDAVDTADLADTLRDDLAIPADVLTVHDGTDGDCDGCSPLWSRTYTAEEWKGYKDGGKCYLSEAELLRRWGPVTAFSSSGSGLTS